jgi:hypothetical protein
MFSSLPNPLHSQLPARRARVIAPVEILLFAGLFAVLAIGGCKTSKHSSDARLRAIDEMLDAELPKGTNLARVSLFLNERGYRVENPGKGQTVVAVVRKIDTETLRPVNARVTFHFDAQDQLQSYEMTSAPDEPMHP